MAYGSHAGQQAGLRALSGGVLLCYLSQPAARRGGHHRLRRRGPQLRPAVHAAGAVSARCCTRSSRPKPGTRTDFAKPFSTFRSSCTGAACVVVISDFYEDPETVIKTMEPLRFHGNEVILFHVLDPQEIRPTFTRAGAAARSWKPSDAMEVTPDYASTSTGQKIDAHIERAARPGPALGNRLFPAGHQPAAR